MADYTVEKSNDEWYIDFDNRKPTLWKKRFFRPAETTLGDVTVTPATATISVNNTEQLEATVDATYKAESAWESSDEDVAIVSSTGLVTGIAAGEATITYSFDTASDTCDVTVNG